MSAAGAQSSGETSAQSSRTLPSERISLLYWSSMSALSNEEVQSRT